MIEFFLIFLKRCILWNKILPRNYVLTVLIGFTVIVRPTVNFRNGAGPVSMNVFLGRGPFQGV